MLNPVFFHPTAIGAHDHSEINFPEADFRPGINSGGASRLSTLALSTFNTEIREIMSSGEPQTNI